VRLHITQLREETPPERSEFAIATPIESHADRVTWRGMLRFDRIAQKSTACSKSTSSFVTSAGNESTMNGCSSVVSHVRDAPALRVDAGTASCASCIGARTRVALPPQADTNAITHANADRLTRRGYTTIKREAFRRAGSSQRARSPLIRVDSSSKLASHSALLRSIKSQQFALKTCL
jgi:hypothetical protein